MDIGRVYKDTILGDCIEKLKSFKDNCIDLLLTDPPYGMNFQSNHRTNKYNKIHGDDNLEWLDIFIEESYRVLKDNRVGYIFCSYHNVDIFKQAIEKKFKLKNILIWEKNNTSMGDLKGDYAPKYEMILFFHKGRRELLGGYRYPNIVKFNRTQNTFHPTEKPVDLLEFLIRNSSLENELVLDPFAGSGGTGLACINSNRQFILIEKELEYYNIIQKRLGIKT